MTREINEVLQRHHNDLLVRQSKSVYNVKYEFINISKTKFSRIQPIHSWIISVPETMSSNPGFIIEIYVCKIMSFNKSVTCLGIMNWIVSDLFN